MVYFNDSLSLGHDRAAVLDRYAYAVGAGPDIADLSSSVDRQSFKTFVAERYGGDGIGRNGGGGRCGFDGVWQLKGLGPNRLLDKDIDSANGDGNQCLHTAIYESIWAEIIHVALPYGAIRSIAILNTGLSYEKYGQPRTRGLIVREPAVRPAHFMRAIYFKQQQLDRLGEDARRVKAAIKKLYDFLPQNSMRRPGENQQERLEQGLIELARRYAKQFAVAKAKRISHCNVSASNLSLNGAWLDLSGSRLFTHAVAGDRANIDKFNTEYAPAINAMLSLCYYLSKYTVISRDLSEQLSHTMIQHFTECYYKHLSLYEIAQTGFPLWVLEPLADSEAFGIFYKDMCALLSCDNFKVNPIDFQSSWKGYERWTCKCYLELLSAKLGHTVTKNVLNQVVGTAQTEQLCASFNDLFDLASATASRHGINKQNFARCVALNLIRRNRTHNTLHDLTARIKDIDFNREDAEDTCQRLANEAVRDAKLHLGSETGHIIPVWLSNELYIEFDPLAGLFNIDQTHSRTLTAAELFDLGEQHDQIKTALLFYNNVWSIFNEDSVHLQN